MMKENKERKRTIAPKENNTEKKTGSRCPVSKKCGGCKWIDKEYTQQLKEKEKWVKQLA